MNNVSIWFRATRPFSFTASIIPVLFAAVCAFAFHNGPVDWWLFPFVLFGALLFHIGANLLSDYFDFIYGVDRQDTFGGSRVLVEGLLPPKKVLYGAVLSFCVGFLLGLILVWVRGYEVLLMGLGGLFCGVFYTLTRKGLKYIALGDVAIFIAFGPLLIIGSYFSLTGIYPLDIVILSLPIGFLVVAILHANNTRDIKNDASAKIKTLPILLGLKASQVQYYFLVFGAYVLVLLFVIFKMLSPISLIVLLTLPIALKNAREISQATTDNFQPIFMLDVKTAQLHLTFGLLLTISILIMGLL